MPSVPLRIKDDPSSSFDNFVFDCWPWVEYYLTRPICDLNFVEKFVFSEGLDKASQSHHLSTNFRTRSQGSAAEISSIIWTFGILKWVRLFSQVRSVLQLPSQKIIKALTVFGCCGVSFFYGFKLCSFSTHSFFFSRTEWFLGVVEPGLCWATMMIPTMARNGGTLHFRTQAMNHYPPVLGIDILIEAPVGFVLVRSTRS